MEDPDLIEDDDLLGTGLAAYAMMTVLLTGLAQGGEEEKADARTIIDGAKEWLSRPRFARSSRVKVALERMQNVEKIAGLLAMKTEGSTQ